MLEQSPVSGATVFPSAPLHQGVRFSTAEIKKRIDEMFDTSAAPLPSES
ncbi:MULTISPECIES: hypothetical protein [Rhodococcus]|uniref:Uncharacterized protein n=1 Tax=Rhodococcus rhodochrous J45 TaxID=935266 RepID=A0A562D9A8_RHORH|nr:MULTISPECIES: hypothetical protein [Rhodococcus]TWH06199.1 hypothetical protein L618_000700000980 [Rhodococcus rhodochrous J45]